MNDQEVVNDISNAASQMGKKGGPSKYNLYGKDEYSKMGKKGGKGKLARYGKAAFAEMGRKSAEARRKKKESEAKLPS